MRRTRGSWAIALAALATGAVVLPTQAHDEVDLLHRDGPPPASPRYTVTSGVFGEDWDGPRAGKPWDLLVWGDGTTTCWQVVEEGYSKSEGRTCSRNVDPEALRRTAFDVTRSFYSGSRDPDEYMFVAGETGPRVHRLVFRGDRGPDMPVRLFHPPPSTPSPYRYYAAVLPQFDFARLVALSEDGAVIATHRLCGIGCVAGRWFDERADLRAYEAAPVTLESAAAAFAITAAGRAGLIDRLGTFWRYRGISDDLVATFRPMDCSAASTTNGRRCDTGAGAARVEVGVEDGMFYVASAQGPMTGKQRAGLEAYTEPVTDDVREWRLVAASFAGAGRREWDVAFALVWTGDMDPPSDYESPCRLTVYASGGDVIERRRDLPFGVRADERHRVSGLLTSVRGPRLPQRLDVECDPARTVFFG